MLAHLVLEAELRRGCAERNGGGGARRVVDRIRDWFAFAPNPAVTPEDDLEARAPLHAERRLRSA